MASSSIISSFPSLAAPVQFKVDLGEVLRRFALEIPTFVSLQQTIKQVYVLSNGASFSVKYRDTEDDLITISSDLELREAINLFGEGKNVRLTIQLGTASPIGAQTSSVTPTLAPRCVPFPVTPLVALHSTAAAEMSRSACKENKWKAKQQWKEVKKEGKLARMELKSKMKEQKETDNEEKKEDVRQLKEKLYELKVQVKEQKQQVKQTRELLKESKKECKQRPKEGIIMARFVKDITMHDETEVLPLVPFIKTWRFRNESNKPWPEGSRLLFIGKNSDRLGAPDFVPINVPVLPNQEIEISVPLQAPQEQGRYTAYFRLADATGKKFGQRVWVMIRVYADSSSSSEESCCNDNNVVTIAQYAEQPKKANKKFFLTTELQAKFAAQLSALHEMQFTNDRLNLRLLNKHKGSMELVVVSLLHKRQKAEKKIKSA